MLESRHLEDGASVNGVWENLDNPYKGRSTFEGLWGPLWVPKTIKKDYLDP